MVLESQLWHSGHLSHDLYCPQVQNFQCSIPGTAIALDTSFIFILLPLFISNSLALSLILFFCLFPGFKEQTGTLATQ